MGFEDYQVYLTDSAHTDPGASRCTRDRITQSLLEEWKQIHLDDNSVEQSEYPQWSGRTYLLFETSEHLFEMCVSEDGNLRVAISLRFALCNPPSLYEDFCHVVGWLMKTYGFECVVARDLDPALPSRRDIARDPAEFYALFDQSVGYNRLLWEQDAGTTESRKLRPEEAVYELFLTPRGLI